MKKIASCMWLIVTRVCMASESKCGFFQPNTIATLTYHITKYLTSRTAQLMEPSCWAECVGQLESLHGGVMVGKLLCLEPGRTRMKKRLTQ